VADEIPDRKLPTTDVNPVFRLCLFNIAHFYGKLMAVALPTNAELYPCSSLASTIFAN